MSNKNIMDFPFTDLHVGLPQLKDTWGFKTLRTGFTERPDWAAQYSFMVVFEGEKPSGLVISWVKTKNEDLVFHKVISGPDKTLLLAAGNFHRFLKDHAINFEEPHGGVEDIKFEHPCPFSQLVLSQQIQVNTLTWWLKYCFCSVATMKQ